MSRLVGAVLVVLAAAGIGNELAGEVKRRLNALYQCKTLVTFLQSQIRYAVSDLSEMFREAGDRQEGAFRSFCRRLAEETAGNCGRDFAGLWEDAVGEDLAASGLNAEDRRLLASVGPALGYLDGESQCRQLENYLERLEPEIGRAEAETRSKCSLYRKLAVFAGLFLTILFL